MPFGCIWLVLGGKEGGLVTSVAVVMREAAHTCCNGADGGSGAVMVDCGVAATSIAVVKLECGHCSTVLEEVRLRQCWV
jgi:hypothetical protein